MRNSSPMVIIVLLNYKGAEDTIECLQSLLQISYQNYRITIVDNDSPDNSMEEIEQHLISECIDHLIYYYSDMADESAGKLPLVTLIQSGRNGGYGYGNNIGIKYALANNADYVLALNNDTVVEPGFLEPLVQNCEDDDRIGIATGKIYFYDRPDVLWFNGGKFNHYTAKVEHINFNEKDIGQQPPIENTFLSGCMWLIPKHVFETVGYINEEYFMYVEDLEYCQRVMYDRRTLKVCEKSHIWHKVGCSTGGRFSRFAIYWRTKNMNSFIAKSGIPLWCKLSAFVVFNLKLIITLIRNKQPSLFRIYFQAIQKSIKAE